MKISIRNFLISALALITWSSCTHAQTSDPASTATIVKDINAITFERMIREEPGQVIDVRTAGEVSRGMIQGATNLDFQGKDFTAKLSKLDHDKPVYVYCAVGGRSGRAVKMMEDMGFSKIYNLKGGFKAWQAAGFESVPPGTQ